MSRAEAQAGNSRPAVPSVTIEAMIPRGAMVGYGLIGVSFEVDANESSVGIEVPWVRTPGPLWQSPLVLASEKAHAGLLEEFSGAVLAGLERAATGRLAPGRLRLTAAACGAVGSSPIVMHALASACVELALTEDVRASNVVAILERTLQADR